MCCFNKPVNHVGATRIMVFVGKDGRQVTLYENVVRGTGKTSPHPSGPGKAPVAPEKVKNILYYLVIILAQTVGSVHFCHLLFPLENLVELLAIHA